jgi:hypothetical protein
MVSHSPADKPNRLRVSATLASTRQALRKVPVIVLCYSLRCLSSFPSGGPVFGIVLCCRRFKRAISGIPVVTIRAVREVEHRIAPD